MEVLSLCSIMGLCAWEDLRTKEIRVWVVGLLAVLGVCFHIGLGRLEIPQMLGGCAVGVVLYGVSLLSKEAIGKGDALCFMATGIYLGFWGNLFLLWSSFVVAGIVGILYGKIRGVDKEVSLPFLPYVFVCLVLQLVVGGGL